MEVGRTELQLEAWNWTQGLALKNFHENDD